uniref:Prefoldin subunit 2 n=1 Tax=Chelonoidis abingdonii TaxID=106734 RepID=A0A8C0J3L9_CHEAB
MADSGKSKSAPTALSTGKALTAEQVVAAFNRLRQEQRGLASKAAELELELNEHSLVIDMLRDVDPTRKCYRMVGRVLVERTVKEVLPALESNKELSLSNLTRYTLPNVGTRTGSRGNFSPFTDSDLVSVQGKWLDRNSQA